MLSEHQNFGPYVLLKRIASGGMAEVFLARNRDGIEGFEKLSAIKVIHPHLSTDQQFIELLVAEAKLASQLSHLNIVQVHTLGEVDGIYYIAMEYIEGHDLYQSLVRCAEVRS